MSRFPRSAVRKRSAILALSSTGGLIGLVAIMAMVAVSAGLGSLRTIVLDAQATGLRVTFSGAANDWSLGSVTVCEPRPRVAWTLPRGEGVCDARRYVETTVEGLRVNWNANANVLVTSPSPGALALDVSGQTGVADRTRIVLSRESWAATGALTFTGTALVGEQLASGETKMILSGSFEAREKPLWSANTEVLKSGPIRRGESAAVFTEARGEPVMAEVFGHVTPLEAGRPGFNVGLVSAPGPVFLQLGFFGAAAPTRVAPSWIDRALTSPLILALAALLSVLLSAGQIMANATAALRALPFKPRRVASSTPGEIEGAATPAAPAEPEPAGSARS